MQIGDIDGLTTAVGAVVIVLLKDEMRTVFRWISTRRRNGNGGSGKSGPSIDHYVHKGQQLQRIESTGEDVKEIVVQLAKMTDRIAQLAEHTNTRIEDVRDTVVDTRTKIKIVDGKITDVLDEVKAVASDVRQLHGQLEH